MKMSFMQKMILVLQFRKWKKKKQIKNPGMKTWDKEFAMLTYLEEAGYLNYSRGKLWSLVHGESDHPHSNNIPLESQSVLTWARGILKRRNRNNEPGEIRLEAKQAALS